jgi:RND family efflux transporter MFP subunit
MNSKASEKSKFTAWKSYAGAITAVGLIVAVLAWQGDVFTAKMDPGSVEDTRTVAEKADTVRVVEEDLPIHRILVGSVMPRESVELAAQIPGKVLDVSVEVGDRVETAQLIMRIDPSLSEAQVAEAEAALEMARADLTGTEAMLTLVEAATEANALPRTEAVNARRARDRAARAVERRLAALDAAQTQRGYTELISPIEGVLMDRLRDPGDLVMPGQPVALLYDPSRLEIEVAVPASLLKLFSPGTEVLCEIDALETNVTSVVRTKEPRIDPATRTALVKLTLDPPTGAVPGMFVRVRMEQGLEKTVVVPASAVGRLRSLTYARVVNEQGRIDHRLVRPGRRMEDRLEILAGLEIGEQVLRSYEWRSGGGEAE